MKITAKTVSTAQLPKGKLDTIYFDDVLRGFGLRLRISGGRLHRSYCVQYKREPSRASWGRSPPRPQGAS